MEGCVNKTWNNFLVKDKHKEEEFEGDRDKNQINANLN